MFSQANKGLKPDFLNQNSLWEGRGGYSHMKVAGIVAVSLWGYNLQILVSLRF